MGRPGPRPRRLLAGQHDVDGRRSRRVHRLGRRRYRPRRDRPLRDASGRRVLLWGGRCRRGHGRMDRGHGAPTPSTWRAGTWSRRSPHPPTSRCGSGRSEPSVDPISTSPRCPLAGTIHRSPRPSSRPRWIATVTPPRCRGRSRRRASRRRSASAPRDRPSGRCRSRSSPLHDLFDQRRDVLELAPLVERRPEHPEQVSGDLGGGWDGSRSPGRALRSCHSGRLAIGRPA